MHNVSSSYFDAASLTVALLAASFGLLGGHGLVGVVWHGWPAFKLHDEQLQLASSGNQFSKNRPHLTYSALACFTLMPVSNIKTVLSVSVAGIAAFSEGMNRFTQKWVFLR